MTDMPKECETCKGDRMVCASIPSLRHCEKANRSDPNTITLTREELEGLKCPNNDFYDDFSAGRNALIDELLGRFE